MPGSVREIEQWIRASVEAMPENFTLFSVVQDEAGRAVDFRCEYINEAGCRMNGRSREETLGRKWTELFPAPEGSADLEDFLRAAETGEPVVRDAVAFPGDDPGARAFDIRAFRMGDGLAFYAMDVTERKKGQDALARLATIPELTPNLVVEVDPEGNVCYANPAARRIFPDLEEAGPSHPWLAGLGQAIDLFRQGEDRQVSLVVSGEGWRFHQVFHYLEDLGRIRIYSIDISERLANEEALRRKAEELETLLESMPVPVWIAHDPEANHITGNRAAENFLGIPHGGEASLTAPPGRRPDHFRILRDGRELQAGELPMKKAARGGKVSGYDCSFLFADGTVRHAVTNAAPLFDSRGRPRGAISAFVDITERKRMEEALRESERRFRRLFDQSPLGAALVSPDFRFLDINKSFTTITGYVLEELASMTFIDFTHPDDLAADLPQAKRLLAGWIDQYEMEKRFLHKEGGVVWVRLNVGAIRDEEGRTLSFMPVIEDITDRKRMEEALEAARQHLGAHMDNSPVAVMEFAPDSRIIRWNLEAERLFGWSAEEVIGKEAMRLRMVHEEDEESVLQAWGDMLGGKRSSILHVNRNRRKDGSIAHCEWYNSAIYDSRGRLKSILSQVLDVTEQRRTEEALRSSLEEKDNLLRELSHRTKNNMQVIMGLLGLQAAEADRGNLVATLSDAQDRIRAMALVHEKLYRSGNFSTLDMKEYMKDLLVSLLKAHQGAGGRVEPVLELEEIRLSLDSALPCGLIINELVSNSLKHAFGGREAGTIFLSMRSLGEEVELRYRDDGPGLPRDLDLSNVHTLGLKLIHNLGFRQLRGTVRLAHDPPSEFTIRFPASATKERRNARRPAPA